MSLKEHTPPTKPAGLYKLTMENEMKLSRIATLAAAGILAFIACSGENKVEKEIIRPVRYQKISLEGNGKARTFSGTSRAAMEVKLSFKVGGTIQSVNVKVGDRVKKGAPIASLDKKDFQLKYEQARAAVANVKVQAQTAKSTFERTAALYETNNVSLQDFERARTAYESAKAGLNSAERGLQLAKSQLNYTRLNAPMDGIVTEVKMEKNENAAPGQIIAELSSGSELEVSIGVPESYISRIKDGDKVKVSFPAIKGKTFEGSVTEVSYSISSASSTYPVSVTLDKPSKKIRPGMAADVLFQFKAETRAARIVVPVNTVAEDQTGRFVYTVTENDSGLAEVHRKKVTTGDLTARGLEIREGLEDGELVVTAGISKLTDGMIVRLLK
jgi:RND family efflux transporter MFP subunit